VLQNPLVGSLGGDNIAAIFTTKQVAAYHLGSEVLKAQKRYKGALRNAEKAAQLKNPVQSRYLDAFIDLRGQRQGQEVSR
jgi:hypothetical protein